MSKTAATNLRRSARGQRERIKTSLKAWIREQGLEPGDQLISQVKLAEHFGTTQVTVHRAMRELSDEGVLRRVKGKGTFVADRHRVETTETTRQMCLVLPEAHLDDPRSNPEFWDQLQSLLCAFIEAGGAEWSFGTRTIAPDADSAPLAAQLAGYDAVFFHFDRPPKALIQRLTREAIVPVVKLGQPEPDLDCLSIDHDREASTAAGIARAVGGVGSSSISSPPACVNRKNLVAAYRRRSWPQIAISR